MLTCQLFSHLDTADKVKLALSSQKYKRDFDRTHASKLLYSRFPSQVRYVRRLFVTIDTLAKFKQDDLQFITHLRLAKCIRGWYRLESDMIPRNLESLIIDSGCSIREITIPISLRVFINRDFEYLLTIRNLANHPNLTILDCSNAVVENSIQLPAQLIYLVQTQAMRPTTWPVHLQVLRFEMILEKVDALPPNLIKWDCGDFWNHPLPKLPESLQTLRLGPGFSHPIQLPTSLTSLTLTSSKQVENLPTCKSLVTMRSLLCLNTKSLNTKSFYEKSQSKVDLWPGLFPNLKKLCCSIPGRVILPDFHNVRKVDVTFGSYPYQNLSFCGWTQLTHASLEIWANNEWIENTIRFDFPNSLVSLKMEVHHVLHLGGEIRLRIPDNLTKLDLSCPHPFFEVWCGTNSKLRKLSSATRSAMLPTSKVPSFN